MRKKIDFEKERKLYFSLKEVARHFDVNTSLLRFWEKEFDIIRPRKTVGGTRQYTREDINDIEVVYHLVKEKGMTLEGARQELNRKFDDTEQKIEVIKRLEKIKTEIEKLSEIFDELDKNNL